ncbi:helix-turn-helix domain-containing protein [Leptolyngbya sp. NIES-2104]|uniref:helix-turn-helix domain-containing protein n=1 Tax=Leptolyngbya sp. NIES-2104 TaxID=1552121 RepID=UPI0006ECB763|nr:helix-turn-helix domain-containing protein [Leptolyngbya sp. NIES-2104]GAP97982.1 transcriptional regulator, AraC family [Leptolyngbya sp. NIES-2104]
MESKDTEPQSLAANLAETESASQIFPRSPVQMSDPSAWQNIFLVHHRQPAWEMPENYLAQPIVSVNIGAAQKLERVIEGRLQRENFLTGNIALYPAEVDYCLRWEKEAEFLLVGLDPNHLSQLAAEVSGKETVELLPLLSAPDPLIHQLALALKSELESPQVGGKLYVDTIAQTFALHLLRNYTSSQPRSVPSTLHGLPQHKLQQATDYIQDALDRDLSLAELAAVVQMSPFHFAHLFKQSTGLAPHQFVIRCRVERAKELLLHSSLSIADIAVEVGFANQSHLTRHFRRIVGVTPRTVLANRKNVPNSAKT